MDDDIAKSIVEEIDAALAEFKGDKISAAAAGEIIGVSRETMRKLIASGSIAACKVNTKEYRLLKSVVRKYVLSRYNINLEGE